MYLAGDICEHVCGKPTLLMNTKWCLLVNNQAVEYIFRAICRDTKPSHFSLLFRRVLDAQPLSKPTLFKGLEPPRAGKKPL